MKILINEKYSGELWKIDKRIKYLSFIILYKKKNFEKF